MKIKAILSVIIVALASCQQSHKAHDTTKTDNVMVKAMEDSMTAMHQTKLTGNADVDFAAMMVPHHEGAVEMAEQLLKVNNTDSLADFAKKVIQAQKEEIGQLKAFLATGPTTASPDAKSFQRALNASMRPMMDSMSQIKPTGSLQKDFIALMIPHHQSAVEMAKAYLPYATDASIKKMAMSIIEEQEKEIAWLKRL